MRGFLIAWVYIFSTTLVLAQTGIFAKQEGGKAPRAQMGAEAQPSNDHAWEEKFRAIPDPANLRAYMKRLTARPHHLGSPYDKENAEWILAKFKEWGLDAKIESYEVLFPSPKERLVEMIEPTQFKAKLQEPSLSEDPTSSQLDEQLPTYNAYSADGDVTGELVFLSTMASLRITNILSASAFR